MYCFFLREKTSVSRAKDTFDFYFISKVTEYLNLDWYKSLILIGGIFLVIILAALNIISLFMGLIIMILVSMVLKVTHPKDIPNNIDYNLAMVIVLSLALGTAMIKSGAADLVANGVISAFFPFGKIGVLLGIYLITALLAAYITTKAAVAIVFPIALSVAQTAGRYRHTLCACCGLCSCMHLYNPARLCYQPYGIRTGRLFVQGFYADWPSAHHNLYG